MSRFNTCRWVPILGVVAFVLLIVLIYLFRVWMT